jgi:hypothetical protein
MAMKTNTNSLEAICTCLGALAARLDPKDAVRIASALTDRITKETDPTFLSALSRTLSIFAVRLDSQEGAQAAIAYFEAEGKLPHSLLWIISFRSYLTGDLPPQTASNISASVACSGDGVGLASSLALLHQVIEPPCRFTTPQLVEMLKEPLCVGPARRDILDQLEIRYRQKFIDQWEFVRFAQERNLGLDFTGQPKRLAVPAK